MSFSLKNVGIHGLKSITAAKFTLNCNNSIGVTVTAVSNQRRDIHLLVNTSVRLRNYPNLTTGSLAIEKYQQNSSKQNNSSRCCLLTSQQRNQSNFFHKYQQIMDAPPGIFKGSVDRFNGITVDSSTEYVPSEAFVQKLEKSLDYWKTSKRRAIWFLVKTEHAEWVPHLTERGFDFHHAKRGFTVLFRWLPTDEYENIPAYPHTMLGVGGLVVNNNNEVLVVSERFALIRDSWKLPGGYVEPNENIIDAAIREVDEETGVKCEFDTVVSIRHSHGGIFNCSDIYCVVALTPKTLDLQRCEREIAKLQWMPVEEYLKHPNVHETNRQFMKSYLDYKKQGIRFTCGKGVHQVLKKEYCLYYMQPIEEQNEKKE